MPFFIATGLQSQHITSTLFSTDIQKQQFYWGEWLGLSGLIWPNGCSYLKKNSWS